MSNDTRKQKTIKKILLKTLTATGKQFYGENGEPITVEAFVDSMLSMPLAEALELQKEIERKKAEDKAAKEAQEAKEQEKPSA